MVSLNLTNITISILPKIQARVRDSYSASNLTQNLLVLKIFYRFREKCHWSVLTWIQPRVSSLLPENDSEMLQLALLRSQRKSKKLLQLSPALHLGMHSLFIF